MLREGEVGHHHTVEVQSPAFRSSYDLIGGGLYGREFGADLPSDLLGATGGRLTEDGGEGIPLSVTRTRRSRKGYFWFKNYFWFTGSRCRWTTGRRCRWWCSHTHLDLRELVAVLGERTILPALPVPGQQRVVTGSEIL